MHLSSMVIIDQLSPAWVHFQHDKLVCILVPVSDILVLDTHILKSMAGEDISVTQSIQVGTKHIMQTKYAKWWSVLIYSIL